MTKKYAAVLFIGILLGFTLGRHFSGKTTEPQVTAQEEDATPAAPSAPAPETPPEPQVAAAPTPPPPAAPAGPDPRKQIPPLPEGSVMGQPNSDPEIAQLTIDESLADKLESDWEDLPNQIHVMKEERGFRVLYIKEGSLIQQTGLHNGDLITRETLEALGGNGSPLANRVARILGHVSVY